MAHPSPSSIANRGRVGPLHPRHVVRSGIRATAGILPAIEYRLRAKMWRQARRLQRVEDEMVASIRRQQGGVLPPSDVVTIIPTYRRPERLALAVDSALAQTVAEQRVVVIDDGGGIDTDLPEDPRLSVIRLPMNTGVAGVVRNIGIRLSCSRLLAFLDDDNLWTPDHLETALSRHNRSPLLTYSALQRVDDTGEPVDVLSTPFDRRRMRNESIADTNVIVVNRSPDVLFSRLRRGRTDNAEDWELVWRLSRKVPVLHIPHVTVRYTVHAGSYYSAWGGGS